MRIYNTFHNQRGVSLVEIIIIVIVLGMVAMPYSNGFISVSRSFIINDEVLQSNAYAQSCAEHILYFRRSPDTATQGYANLAISATSTACVAVPNPAGLVINVDIEGALASLDPACATGNCKSVTVTVASSGQTRANIEFLLMN